MSLNNPSHRPWRQPKVTRTITMSAWVVVVILAMLTVVAFVQSHFRHGDLFVVWVVLLNVLIVTAIGSLFIDLSTVERRGAGDGTPVARFFGSPVAGGGLGMVVAAVLEPGAGILLAAGGLLVLIIGATTFVSPVLLDRYRKNKARSDAHIRGVGVRTLATVTEVHQFSRGDSYLRYRVTLQFTDQQGNQRWLVRNAAPGSRPIDKGESIPLHYDPGNPSRRRSLVVDWPTYG